jgi:CRISPR-associated protein Csm2
MKQLNNSKKGSKNTQKNPCRREYSLKDIKDILDGDTKLLVEKAREIAKDELLKGKNEVSTSQIRNIYGTVKKLEMRSRNEEGVVSEEVIGELMLLKPKLAYVAGRHKRVEGLQCLRDVLCEAIDCVYDRPQRFDMFCKFFEAILAYHRAEGGK